MKVEEGRDTPLPRPRRLAVCPCQPFRRVWRGWTGWAGGAGRGADRHEVAQHVHPAGDAGHREGELLQRRTGHELQRRQEEQRPADGPRRGHRVTNHPGQRHSVSMHVGSRDIATQMLEEGNTKMLPGLWYPRPNQQQMANVGKKKHKDERGKKKWKKKTNKKSSHIGSHRLPCDKNNQ